MSEYAALLKEASFHRRASLKSEVGAIDREVFWYLGVTLEQVNLMLAEQFTQLKVVNSLTQDIARNAILQNRVIIQDVEGRDITPKTSNVYNFVKKLLKNSMICLGMTEGNRKRHLNQKALAINCRFSEIVSKTKAVSIEKSNNQAFKKYSKLNPDQLREPIAEFVRELKSSSDPEMGKLAFALLSLNQTWVTIPGQALSAIAREVYGRERFSGSGGAEQLHGETRIKIKFQDDGSIRLKAKGGHTNKDYVERGEADYTCVITTDVKVDGIDNAGVSNFFLLYHRYKKDGEVSDLK